jgi:hypothetical protein
MKFHRKDMKDAPMKTGATEQVLEDGMNTDTYEGDIHKNAEKAASSLQGPEVGFLEIALQKPNP